MPRRPMNLDYPGAHDGQMVRNQLRILLQQAAIMHQMIMDGDDLPGWVLSYITVAQDRLLTAATYLQAEITGKQIRSNPWRMDIKEPFTLMCSRTETRFSPEEGEHLTYPTDNYEYRREKVALPRWEMRRAGPRKGTFVHRWAPGAIERPPRGEVLETYSQLFSRIHEDITRHRLDRWKATTRKRRIDPSTGQERMWDAFGRLSFPGCDDFLLLDAQGIDISSFVGIKSNPCSDALESAGTIHSLIKKNGYKSVIPIVQGVYIPGDPPLRRNFFGLFKSGPKYIVHSYPYGVEGARCEDGTCRNRKKEGSFNDKASAIRKAKFYTDVTAVNLKGAEATVTQIRDDGTRFMVDIDSGEVTTTTPDDLSLV